jgi:transcriptional regulator with XRE-family HTH domain
MPSKPSKKQRTARPSATHKLASSNEVDDKELQKRVGLAIRLARIAKGWTQRELAQAIGRSQNFVFSIESGKSDPGVVALRRIAAAMETSVDVFLAPIVVQYSPKSKAEQQVFNKAQELFVNILKTVNKRGHLQE